MGLKYRVENVDELPEGIRDAYRKADDESGGFVLDVEGVTPDEELSGLKSALDKERGNAKTASKELQRYRDEVAELREERDRLLDSSGTEEELKRIRDAFDRKLESARNDHEREKTSLTDKLQGRDRMLEKVMADGRAEALAAQLAVDEPSTPVLRKLIRERLRVTIDDDADEPRLVVLGRDGKETDKTVDDLRSELLEDKSMARLVTDTRGKGGGGSPRSRGKGTGSPDRDRKPASREDRRKSIADRYGLDD